MYLLFLLISLFGNLWIWRILGSSVWLGLLMLSVTLLIIKSADNGRLRIFAFILFIAVLFFQWRTTEVNDLVNLDNDEQRLQQQRLREYPPVKISVGNKTLWIPVGHWFEGRSESIAFFRVKQNLFENLDLNLYFFSGHPRERILVREFEKFPYLLLPFFVLGIYELSKSKRVAYLTFIILPLIAVSIIGNRNVLGPFSVFPFFVMTIYLGLKKLLGRIYLVMPVLILLVLNIIQMVYYELF